MVNPATLVRHLHSDAYEVKRAAELQAEIGPKTANGTGAWADFLIDLHSTTSNMGLSLVMNGAQDAMACRVAHHLQNSVSHDLKVGCRH